MLHVDPIEMVLLAFNLLVLYLILRRFLFGPVTRVIEKRQNEIEHNIASAVDQKAQAEAMLEEYDGKLKNAQQEASQLIAHAKTRAEHEYQTVVKRAQSEAKRVTEETSLQIENERQIMLAGVRKEVATLALMAAARVSAHGCNSDEDDALINSFLSEVGDES